VEGVLVGGGVVNAEALVGAAGEAALVLVEADVKDDFRVVSLHVGKIYY